MTKAILEKIITMDGERALPDNKWDSLPEWTYYDACIVKIKVRGSYNWGPFQDSQSKQTATGMAEITITESHIFRGPERNGEPNNTDYLTRADDYILQIGILLERQGFHVEIREKEDYTRQDLRTKFRWINGKPPAWVIKIISRGKYGEYESPSLEKLQPKTNYGGENK